MTVVSATSGTFLGTATFNESRLHNEVNELTSAGSSSFVYDKKGQLLEDDNFRYYWNIDGHMQHCLNKITREFTSYCYDAPGRRQCKYNDVVVTFYSNDFQVKILANITLTFSQSKRLNSKPYSCILKKPIASSPENI